MRKSPKPSQIWTKIYGLEISAIRLRCIVATPRAVDARPKSPNGRRKIRIIKINERKIGHKST